MNLKACPFCGWDGSKSKRVSEQLVVTHIGGDDWAVVCGCCASQGPATDEDLAAEAWNTRVFEKEGK